MEIRADQVGNNSQLATSSEQVCSSRGKRARCIEQAQVIEILERYEKIFNMIEIDPLQIHPHTLVPVKTWDPHLGSRSFSILCLPAKLTQLG